MNNAQPRMGDKAVIFFESKRAFLFRSIALCALFFMHSMLARILGPDDYGRFSYIMAVATSVSSISLLGWGPGIIRFIGEYQTQCRWRLLKGVLIRSHQIVFISGILFALFLYVFGCLLEDGAGEQLVYAAVLVPFLGLLQLRKRVFQGFQRIQLSIILDEIGIPVLTIGAMLFIPMGKQPYGVMAAYFTVIVILTMVGSFLLVRIIPQDVRRSRAECMTWQWQNIAFPMLFGSLGQMLLGRVDVLMLGSIGNMSEVGLYSMANRLALLMTVFLGAINSVVTPLMARSFHSGDIERFRHTFFYAIKLSLSGSFPLFFIFIFWSDDILSMVSDDYSGAANVLRVLCFGQLVNAMTGPVGYALLMSGNQRKFTVSILIVLTLNVVGYSIFIQVFGVMGAAWVTTASICLLNLWQFHLVSRHIVKK